MTREAPRPPLPQDDPEATTFISRREGQVVDPLGHEVIVGGITPGETAAPETLIAGDHQKGPVRHDALTDLPELGEPAPRPRKRIRDVLGFTFGELTPEERYFAKYPNKRPPTDHRNPIKWDKRPRERKKEEFDFTLPQDVIDKLDLEKASDVEFPGFLGLKWALKKMEQKAVDKRNAPILAEAQAKYDAEIRERMAEADELAKQPEDRRPIPVPDSGIEDHIDWDAESKKNPNRQPFAPDRNLDEDDDTSLADELLGEQEDKAEPEEGDDLAPVSGVLPEDDPAAQEAEPAWPQMEFVEPESAQEESGEPDGPEPPVVSEVEPYNNYRRLIAERLGIDARRMAIIAGIGATAAAVVVRQIISSRRKR